MDLGSPWAGWQFALTHNRLSSGKMLSINGYLKCAVRNVLFLEIFPEQEKKTSKFNAINKI
jgi:hypothetical protein